MMMVVTILGILASIAVTEFTTQRMRAKRTEAMLGLRQLWNEELSFFYRTGRFAGTFDELDFEQAGGAHVSPRTYRGIHYTYQLSQPWGPNSFYCIATSQLDSDPWPDVIEVYDPGR